LDYLIFSALVLFLASLLWRFLTRRKRRGPEKAMAIVLGELDALFAPGTIHWQQEKQRITMMRDEVDSGDKPFGYIDLDANKTVIRLPPPEQDS